MREQSSALFIEERALCVQADANVTYRPLGDGKATTYVVKPKVLRSQSSN